MALPCVSQHLLRRGGAQCAPSVVLEPCTATHSQHWAGYQWVGSPALQSKHWVCEMQGPGGWVTAHRVAPAPLSMRCMALGLRKQNAEFVLTIVDST